MIRTVYIQNFKSLRDVTIELERFTVFVGPNASGKSSILQAIHLLCQTFQTQNRDISGELSTARSRGSKGEVELAADTGGKAGRYRTKPLFPPDAANSAHVRLETYGRGMATGLLSPDWKEWRADSAAPSPLPRSVLLRLEPGKLMSPGPGSDPTVMTPDGGGLHAALASMALNDPDTWQRLQADLKRIVPTIRRLRHTKAGGAHSAALLFDTTGGDEFPAQQVSEGTLLVLGLLAELHSPWRPNLILLDDLDRGLHPKAQKELITLLRGLLDTNPDLQIVATTHSPYMLDCMEFNEVRMTHLDDNGATVCKPLTGHPDFNKWKDEFHSGEMWSMFGEKWLVEQGAAQ